MKKKGESGGSGEVPKKKEQKIVYIDDGSTVADMSGTRKGPPRRKSTMKEKWKTYITTVKHDPSAPHHVARHDDGIYHPHARDGQVDLKTWT